MLTFFLIHTIKKYLINSSYVTCYKWCGKVLDFSKARKDNEMEMFVGATLNELIRIKAEGITLLAWSLTTLLVAGTFSQDEVRNFLIRTPNGKKLVRDFVIHRRASGRREHYNFADFVGDHLKEFVD